MLMQIYYGKFRIIFLIGFSHTQLHVQYMYVHINIENPYNNAVYIYYF